MLVTTTWLERSDYPASKMVFKALNDRAPVSSMFTERSRSGYVLRDSTNKLNAPLTKNKLSKEEL